MSSRNDDQKTPPEKENDAGSSFDHMDDIELGRVSPPTKLDFSRLDETKIAKIEMEKNKPVRPDWLWEKRADGSYEYWTRDNVKIRVYIDHLERSARDAQRKMDEVIFTLQSKTGAALNRAEYAVKQITKIMEVLDVDPVVKHELLCIWPNNDRVKCNGYRDGNCAMPIRREEICKDIPKDPIGEEGERPKVLVPAGHSDCEICNPPEEPKTLIGRRVHLKHAPDAVGTVILGVRWDRTGDISNYEVMVRNDIMEPLAEESRPDFVGDKEAVTQHESIEEPGVCPHCGYDGHYPIGWNKIYCYRCAKNLVLEPPEDVGRPQLDAMGGTEEPTTVLCPQCKQPVNRTYDHVEGGVGGGATGHYECPEPPEEPYTVARWDDDGNVTYHDPEGPEEPEKEAE